MPRDDTETPRFSPLRDDAADSGSAELASIEAEQGLLGTLLVRNNPYHQVIEIVRPGDFTFAVHGRIFGAIGKLIDRGDVANPVTLNTLFDQDGALKDIGGARYLAKLAGSAVTLLNAVSYARQIRDLAQRRALKLLGMDLVDDAQRIQLDRSIADIIEDLDRRLIEVDGEAAENAPKLIFAAVDAALAAAERTYQGKTGITTGLVDLDRKLGGLHPSDLTVVAGRPSMGKTALATGIARAAARAGHQVLMFSLEMSAEQLAARELGAAAGVSAQDQRRGPLSAAQMEALVSARTELVGLPLTIDDTSGASVQRLRARSIRHKRQRGLDLVIVDYLQLLHSDRTRPENRVQEVSAITQALKALAKELRVPLVALSQLSRAVESREDKRPHLADLRESGSIEQDADNVIFVYREEYYVEREEARRKAGESEAAFNTRFDEWLDRRARVRGLADLIIAKIRQGSPDVVKTRFDAERTRFENLTTRGEEI
jgi:replicative DNA helicase